MGRHHARNLAELADARLLAVVDVDATRAAAIAARHGVGSFSTVEELLAEEPDLAAATIAAPSALHYELATTLLEAGKHVLVEKPLAATLEQAEQLVATAERNSAVLAVGHVERFNPAVRELKRRVERGEMGTLLSLIARRVGVMPPQVKDANVIADLAIHDIDIFRYLLDADQPQEVYCNAGKAIAADRFDFADVFLRFEDVACFVQANWLTPVKIRSLSVTGTEAYAELRYVTQELDYYNALPIREIASFAEFEAYSEQAPLRLGVQHVEPLALELQEFLRAVRGEPAEIVSGEEGKRSMEVAAAVVELAERQPVAPR
jgi:UDP-N-acetylglucosamine 3-dehydrogenase